MRLAEEGAAVVVGDINEGASKDVAAAIRASGGQAIAVRVDISDDASVAALFATAMATYGGVDAVHVNAADLRPETVMRDGDALTVSLDLFDHTLAVNLRGHLLCTRHAIPVLLERGGGAIA